MKKSINYDGYNVAEIVKLFENGDVLTNVFQVEDGEDGEHVVKKDSNIVFFSNEIEFTEEELNELRPHVEAITE